jgi:hypothetical protein
LTVGESRDHDRTTVIRREREYEPREHSTTIIEKEREPGKVIIHRDRDRY